MRETTIAVRYSCHDCGLADISVDVPARTTNEDIAVWMKRIMFVLAFDHEGRQPTCHPEKLSDIKIPMYKSSQIGEPEIQ